MLDAVEPLPPYARGRLALGVVSLLSPLLDLDASPHGQRRRPELLQLLADVEAAEQESPVLKEALSGLEASEELAADEEPDGPPAFRVDFAAVLLYAVRTLNGSDADFQHGWSRAADSVAFLVEYAERRPG